MLNPTRLTLAALLVALVTGCASQNPYDSQSQQSSGGMSKTAKYGGLGALAGAVAGAAINHDNRGKGALIGAAGGPARPVPATATTSTSRKKSCAAACRAPASRCSVRATPSS